MGGVVSAIGDAVGGVADAVGDVVETAVDVASDVIDTVASNPLLLAAAIATPIALEAMAVDAVGYTALDTAFVDAGGVLGSTGFGGAIGSVVGSEFVPSVLTTAGGMGLTEGAVAAGTDILGSSFIPSVLTTEGGLGMGTAGLTASEVGGGGWSAFDSMNGAFNFSTADQAANFGSSVLEASGSANAASTIQQTTASSILGDNVPTVFQNQYVNPSLISDAAKSVEMVSQGVPFSEVVPNASSVTDAFMSSAKDIYGNVTQLSKQAEGIINKVGQTLLPDASPEVQNLVSKAAFNTAASGGDIEKAIKDTALGAGVGMVGKEITDLTGSKLLGGAGANAAGAILSGASPEQAFIGSGINVLGSGVTDLTGSSLIGGAAKTAAGSILGGGDIGSSLLNFGIDAGVNQAVNQLGIPTSGLIGQITKPVIGSLTNEIKSTLLPTQSVANIVKPPAGIAPLKLASLTKTLNTSSPLTKTSNVATSNVLPGGTVMPAQTVSVSKLKPVDLSSLGLKVS